jgi:hypothetical protein
LTIRKIINYQSSCRPEIDGVSASKRKNKTPLEFYIASVVKNIRPRINVAWSHKERLKTKSLKNDIVSKKLNWSKKLNII